MMTDKELSKAWHDGNNAGDGYAACSCAHADCGCDLATLDDVSGTYDHTTPDGLAVYVDGDDCAVVGDAHGPWAVDVAEQKGESKS